MSICMHTSGARTDKRSPESSRRSEAFTRIWVRGLRSEASHSRAMPCHTCTPPEPPLMKTSSTGENAPNDVAV